MFQIIQKKNFYSAKVANENAEWMKTSKGRPLKMLKDKKFFKYIENKILNDNYAPDAVIGELKKKNTDFPVLICTKTIYKGIDRGGDFCNITNQNLPIKRNKTHRRYKPISLSSKK